MTDPRALTDEAVVYLDRLGAVILDDVGDGPPARELAASAAAAREVISRIGVSALTQLTGLVAGVADSMVEGTTDWSPSLGGTMMAAVDDLRHLVGRASQFSDEDSEHLHHRAAELSIYVRTSPVIVSEAKDPLSAEPAAEADPAPAAEPEVKPVESRESAAQVTDEAPSPGPSLRNADIIPISQLFFSDQGPHVVTGGVDGSASGRSDLLGRGIDALETLMAQPLATPAPAAVTTVVPVEALLYRGRAALERAAEIREQIRESGAAASPAVLDEMYDLIGLALKD